MHTEKYIYLYTQDIHTYTKHINTHVYREMHIHIHIYTQRHIYTIYTCTHTQVYTYIYTQGDVHIQGPDQK